MRTQIQVVRGAVNQYMLLPSRHSMRVCTHATTAPRVSHTIGPEDISRLGDAIPTAKETHSAHP